MELFERRRYYFCRYCSTFHFLDGDTPDGVHVIDRGTDVACPVCAAALATSLLDGAHAVQYCEQCRGVLVPRASFAEAVTRRRAASGPVATPIPPDRSELHRHLACPSCRSTMDVHPYFGPGNVIIDSCARCNLIWLDFGELKQISEAPGADRGAQAARPSADDAAPVRRGPADLFKTWFD